MSAIPNNRPVSMRVATVSQNFATKAQLLGTPVQLQQIILALSKNTHIHIHKQGGVSANGATSIGGSSTNSSPPAPSPSTPAASTSTSTSSTAAGAGAGAAASTSTSSPPANVQEFTIRVPKNMKKHHHVMRFNATLNVDFGQWKMVKLERENNLKEFRGFDEDMPKFGAGSEYNRELREEVRRKKYGIVAKRYKPEAQPWILKVGGKAGKKFRGIREGGVGENAAFYVFAHAPDGAIEAYPLNEWYNFQPIQRYKALSAEEAEHEFGRRKKVMNYFSLMLRKRMKGDEEEVIDPDEAKANKMGAKKSSKELKISDMDEWIDSDEDSSSEDEDKEKPKKDEADDSDDADAKKKKKKNAKKGAPDKKKKKRDPDDEAFEESDDGDEEGRELDYISESSDSEPDPESKANKEMKSVAEEDALRKLLTSDDDSDEEKKSGESEKEDAEAKSRKDKQEAKEAKEARDKHKKKKLKKKRDDNKKSSGGKRKCSESFRIIGMN